MAQAHHHSVRHLDADDALSDACLAFLRNYNGPPGDDALNWMKALVKYSAWGIARRTRRRESRNVPVLIDSKTGEAEDRELLDPRDPPESFYVRIEEVDEMAGILGQLKPDERSALILFGLGYSYAEIAESRGWTQRKVNRCMVEGRAHVRRLIAGADAEKRGDRI